ncbi:MAG TPA: SHOCT domain-containing protein [Solirubrobacterales bacterium]|nr:SHOCT domain-containing protein [Solirubrobacterales bacterium]
MTLLAGALAPLADCWHHGGGGWFLFPLFWIALIVFLVWMFRRGRWCRPGHHHHRETAAEALEHRFARGEIDDDEYRRRRSVLGGEEKE